jgi:hypothetical protein
VLQQVRQQEGSPTIEQGDDAVKSLLSNLIEFFTRRHGQDVLGVDREVR